MLDFKFYGIDWLAMFLTFIAIWQIGNKKRIGFVLMISGNICWAAIGILTESYAMVVANTVFIAMNSRAIIKWKEEKKL